jgi:hypothetical protein
MTPSTYSKLTAGIIAVWFLIAFSASALHWIESSPTAPPAPLGIAALLPLVLFAVWYRSSRSFREFCMSLDRSVLTMIQSWRVAGFVFLALYTYHILPGMFALPAGWGDMAIGATAPFVAMNWGQPKHKVRFIVWQLFGVVDLVLAVTLGSTASFIQPQGVPTSAMTVLPMSLIPTFAVPLFLMFHFICIAQAYRKSASDRQSFDRVAQPAA